MHKTAPQQPLRTVKLKNKKFTDVLDTGADVSIISLQEQPCDWPLSPVLAAVTGAGGTQIPLQGVNMLVLGGPEGRMAAVKPLVFAIPCTFGGRDLLSQWKIHTTACVSNLRHGV